MESDQAAKDLELLEYLQVNDPFPHGSYVLFFRDLGTSRFSCAYYKMHIKVFAQPEEWQG